MRQQGPPPNMDQVGEHKKSVFERLGRQNENRLANRRPSPGHYGEYMPPPMHEPDFSRYPRDMLSHNEMDWRYSNDRRHMGPFPGERHPGQLPQAQMGPHPPPIYDPSQYYPPPHMYHGNQPNPPPLQPPMSGPGGMPMVMHQRRSSPKYDRHGRPVPMRVAGMEPPGMSPPRKFGPPEMMVHPSQQDMQIMRPMEMYPPQRWHDNLEPEFPPYQSRIMQDDKFSPFEGRPQRYPNQQQPILNPHQNVAAPGNEPPRYIKWRERRDVITNLDRETAQSSSKTDSLRSSLQQPDSRLVKGSGKNPNKNTPASKKDPKDTPKTKQENSEKNPSQDGTKKTQTKQDPQDISDGEIVDDEDSSDESELEPKMERKDLSKASETSYMMRQKGPAGQFVRARDSHDFYEPSKKRRMLEREEYSMDYETISDEDLDDFMGDKKISDLGDDSKLGDAQGDDGGKSVSEIELLNALGLDWAHLVEVAKQSKASSKESTSGSALARFSLPNYIPTLGITADLAGPEIYELIQTACHG